MPWMMRHERERLSIAHFDCPRCGAPAGSACVDIRRAVAGKWHPDWHDPPTRHPHKRRLAAYDSRNTP